ncbi:MAG: hypothetical protein GXO07_00145 [Crenarchaeota archaeon]|nr:hypothetical protein [Thermoproteota archaeon]
MAVVDVSSSTSTYTIYKVPRGVPPKKSIIILGTHEPKYKFLHSLYLALSRLAELGMADTPALFENNVVLGANDEIDYARISFRVGRKRHEKWLVGINSEISSRMLGDLRSAIKALRGELPEELEGMLDNPKEVERLMESSKNFVYAYDPDTQLYASLEMSNLISATEGRKVEKLAIVSMGKGGVPTFVHGSLEAMKELGYIKKYMVIEVNGLDSFEMLKLAKFLLL